MEKLSGRVVHILSNQEDFTGEKGRVDAERILKYAPDLSDWDIYLCGPVPMMRDILETLKRLGVSPARIHYEEFKL